MVITNRAAGTGVSGLRRHVLLFLSGRHRDMAGLYTWHPCSCLSRVDNGTWLDCTLGIRVPVSLGRHWGMAGLYSWRLLEFSSQTALQGGPSTALPPITDEISGSSTSLPALGTVSLSSFSHSYKQWGLTRTCLPAICVSSLVKCPSNLCMLKIIGLFACYSTLRD